MGCSCIAWCVYTFISWAQQVNTEGVMIRSHLSPPTCHALSQSSNCCGGKACSSSSNCQAGDAVIISKEQDTANCQRSVHHNLRYQASATDDATCWDQLEQLEPNYRCKVTMLKSNISIPASIITCCDQQITGYRSKVTNWPHKIFSGTQSAAVFVIAIQPFAAGPLA